MTPGCRPEAGCAYRQPALALHNAWLGEGQGPLASRLESLLAKTRASAAGTAQSLLRGRKEGYRAGLCPAVPHNGGLCPAPCPHTGLWNLRLPVLQTWGMVAVHEVWREEGPAALVHRTGLLAFLQWCFRFASGPTTQLCRFVGQLCQVIQLQPVSACRRASEAAVWWMDWDPGA